MMDMIRKNNTNKIKENKDVIKMKNVLKAYSLVIKD